MIDGRAWVLLCAGAVPLLGCSVDVAERNDVGAISAALSACDETVPQNRNVDGIPAYAQCDAVAAGAMYSNNGVDTSATSNGADWVKTQYSGGYQCTEFAHRYLYFKWDVKWIPNGNAGEWCDTMPPATSGMVQTTTPVHGDIMVLAAGSCGAGTPTGHVNIIDTVDGNGRVTAVEQNVAGRHQYMQSCGKCFLHVVANDGSGAGGAVASGSGGSMVGAGGAAGKGGAGGSAGASGAAAISGAGGMTSPPMQMQPQAGVAAPALPAAKAPMPATAPAGSGGATAAASPTPATAQPKPATNRQSAQDCSVARVGSTSEAAMPLRATTLALLLGLCRVRRRMRREMRQN